MKQSIDNPNGNRIYSKMPICGENPRILLLGSMPSIASINKEQYYGHAQNHFWPLVFHVLEEDCPQDYAQRVARVCARGIAIWDVIKSCEREGSLDKDIRAIIPNDIPAFVQQHPSLRAIGFNGQLAHNTFRKHFSFPQNMDALLLPSSSPVPRRQIKRLEDKLPAWMALQTYLK